ncbi:MAG: hypothetical protein ACI9EF_000191 [Pseudohongiellaceae bacterium]|jgi:hypothetical protein
MREGSRYERVPFLHDGQLAVLPDGKPLEASSIDLSQGGVGLFCPRFLDKGTSVSVSFQFADSNGQLQRESVVATVAYGRVEMEGNYLGVEFTNPLTQDGTPALWVVLQAALKRTTRVDSESPPRALRDFDRPATTRH